MPCQPHCFARSFLWSRRRWLGLTATILTGVLAPTVQAAKARKRPAQTPYPLAAGRHYWMPELSPAGPVVVVVNLHTQLLQVYRNGVTIGVSSISSGRDGYATPVGLFTVLEKQREHRSSTYDNAPMPYMLRLTWQGVALHGGALPGRPASHGCIRLPHAFAARLFGVVRRGDRVAVVNQPARSGLGAVHMLAPLDPQGRPVLEPGLLNQPEYWHTTIAADTPAAAARTAEGPVMLLASLPQRRLFVLQDGKVQGALALPAPDATADADTPPHRLYRWTGGWWQMPGAVAPVNQQPPLPEPVQTRLQPLLAEGSTLLMTQLPAVNDVHVAVWNF